MCAIRRVPSSAVPVGYLYLVNRFELNTLPHYRSSYILEQGRRMTWVEQGAEVDLFPRSYALKEPDHPLAQVEFAMKYDGVNLEILKALFRTLPADLVEEYVLRHPIGKYNRKIWFLYEWLLGEPLSIPDLDRGSYVDLLDKKKYYTGAKNPSKRHRVNENLLGDPTFCPLVRRTTALEEYERLELDLLTPAVIAAYDPLTISRATNFLYTRETMSSFEIEKERPNKSRTARFIELLKRAGELEELSKSVVIDLQNAIVPEEYAASDYRDFQNYVGSLSPPPLLDQVIHYIAPRPEDLEELMHAWQLSTERLLLSELNPVVIAAVSAFAFVFLHPFEDGNGRLHRFIIHQIFATTGFVPSGMILPISATMLKDLRRYDEVLESVSRPLMRALGVEGYRLSDDGNLEVVVDSGDYYRYLDYTQFAEYLFSCVERTIRNEFRSELDFIVQYDEAKVRIQETYEMPDREIDLLIKCLLQNQGRLSERKKSAYFTHLSDQQVEELEGIVSETFKTDGEK